MTGAGERWVAIDDIPGIAARDEIIIVNPTSGILIGRWLPMARYPDLMLYRRLLSPLHLHREEEFPPPSVGRRRELRLVP